MSVIQLSAPPAPCARCDDEARVPHPTRVGKWMPCPSCAGELFDTDLDPDPAGGAALPCKQCGDTGEMLHPSVPGRWISCARCFPESAAAPLPDDPHGCLELWALQPDGGLERYPQFFARTEDALLAGRLWAGHCAARPGFAGGVVRVVDQAGVLWDRVAIPRTTAAA